MSEQIDFMKYRDTFPGFFLIAAIVQGKVLDEVNKNQAHGTPLEIEFKINGVVVPFIDTLNDIWERASKELDEKARKMAKDMVTEAGLDGIMEVLQKCEYELKDAIDRVGFKKD